MADAEVVHMHKDLEELERDVAVIKYIISQEGELTEEAKKMLEEARKAPDSQYVKFK